MRALIALAVLTACADDGPRSSSEGILDGRAGAPALDHVPDLEIPDPLEVIDLDGLSIARDRVVVVVTDAATVGRVNDLAGSLGASLVGTAPDLGLLVLEATRQTDGPAWALDAIEHAGAYADAVVASPDVFASDHVVPEHHTVDVDRASRGQWRWSEVYDAADYATWTRRSASDPPLTWGLKAARLPEAWNLAPHLDASDAPMVLVIDSGFPAHPDLAYAHRDDGGKGDHGLGVAGIIAARWDRVGYSGAQPVAQPVHSLVDRGTAKMLRSFAEGLLGAGARPVVINRSLGASYRDGTGRQSPSGPDDRLPRIVRAEGAVFAEAARRAVAQGRRFLWFCSAGNDNVTRTTKARWAANGVDLDVVRMRAAHASGCAWAAANGHASFLAIEAQGFGGDLVDTSHRDGTLAAPGFRVGVLTAGGRYGWTSGTSQATPLAAGAAALLWTWMPDATPAAIRSALLAGARPASGASAKRLDAFGALEALADAGGPPLAPYLADVDDGTLDGSQRTTPLGARGSDVPVADRGDGCVDMSDLRAFRDALYDADAAYPPFDAEHIHRTRDQNGDGLVDPSAVPWVREGIHSRFDLDGDGRVQVADLDVLTSVFGQCRDGAAATADLEATRIEDLAGLVDSVDLWVPLPRGPQALTLDAPGRPAQALTAAEAAARTVDNHLLVTVARTACDGTANVIVRIAGAPDARYASPTDPAAATDHVVQPAP